MIIAEHLRPGTEENRLSSLLGRNLYPDYTPVCAWPEQCYVQWGKGIIPANPFFEAFPAKGQFIRGDGATIEQAERNAFAQWTKEQSCDHQWGRIRPGTGQTYTNGAGFCQKCWRFESDKFNPIIELGHMRKPLSRSEYDHLHSMETDHELNEHMDRKYPQDRASRLRRARALRLRLNLFGKAFTDA